MADSYISSGTVISAIVVSGSTMYVLSSGTAYYTTIDSHGQQIISAGGHADFTKVEVAATSTS